MDEGILVELGSLVSRHPWWHARARLTVALIDQLGIKPPQTVMDAGCGWGVTLKDLESKRYKVTGMDISRRTLRELDSPQRMLVEADLTKPLPEGHEKFDAVLALDVIEHLDDDRAAVQRFGQLTNPGGYVIVSVPALPEFFTEFDEIQGHRRRYLPETLRAAFEDSCLELERIFWWGQWLVPVLRRQRGSKRSKPGDSIATIYKKYLKLPPWPGPLVLSAGFALEHRRALRGELKTGTSLFAIARRR
jgi:SAM-dependent methyltransferase